MLIKNYIPHTKVNTRLYSSQFGGKISKYFNYLFCNRTMNSKNTKDCEQF